MNDSHAHLTISPIDRNLNEIVKQFTNEGGKHILSMSHDAESLSLVIQQYNELEAQFPGVILIALGIHPEYFSDIRENDGFDLYDKTKRILDMFEQSVNDNMKKLTAIGETGLDYHHLALDSSIKPKERGELMEAQKRSFKKHAELALEHNLPLSIHTRDIEGQNKAVDNALEILMNVGKGRLRGSFHSFTGEPEYIEQITQLGFYIGFNGIITYPNADNVRELVKLTPLDRILVETDCPLLPPQSIRRDKKAAIRYGTPKDVKEVLQYIAEIKGSTYENMEAQIDKNFSELFLRN